MCSSPLTATPLNTGHNFACTHPTSDQDSTCIQTSCLPGSAAAASHKFSNCILRSDFVVLYSVSSRLVFYLNKHDFQLFEASRPTHGHRLRKTGKLQERLYLDVPGDGITSAASSKSADRPFAANETRQYVHHRTTKL